MFTTRIEKDLIYVSGKDGFLAVFSSYGASLARYRVPVGMNSKELRDIVLGFRDPTLYTGNALYAGAVLAPTAGRISGGSLPVNSRVYELTKNENGNVNLHGGYDNASFKKWTLEEVCVRPARGMADDMEAVVLRYGITLPDGLDGFPGNRTLHVTYVLGADYSLETLLQAESDKDTYVNMSTHSYFNLASKTGNMATPEKATCTESNACSESIAWPEPSDHLLQIHADHYIQADDAFLPTQIAPVADTAYDFRTPRTPASNMQAWPDDPQLAAARGYNHVYVLRQAEKADTERHTGIESKMVPEAEKATASALRPAVTLSAPDGALRIDIHTDAPCAVFYSAGFADNSYILCDGKKSAKSCAYAFEMQDYPDAPGAHGFPYYILKAGSSWQRRIFWKLTE